jgi:hypothetical protein
VVVKLLRASSICKRLCCLSITVLTAVRPMAFIWDFAIKLSMRPDITKSLNDASEGSGPFPGSCGRTSGGLRIWWQSRTGVPSKMHIPF